MNMLSKNSLLIGAIALVIGAGLGYGSASAFAKAPAKNAAFAGAGGFRGGMGASIMRGANGSFLTGTVAKEDSESLTINTRDGSSHVVLFTPDTSVSKSVTGSMSDVSVGSEVIVSGTTNSDGSVSANLIQLRPASASQNAPMIPARGQ